jgi:hypothetical protein
MKAMLNRPHPFANHRAMARNRERHRLAIGDVAAVHSDFHEHHLATSHDGKTGLEIIVRKNKERWFPDCGEA